MNLKPELIPEANKNKEKDLLYIYQYTTEHSRKTYTEELHVTITQKAMVQWEQH